jgi:hypothetical protein
MARKPKEDKKPKKDKFTPPPEIDVAEGSRLIDNISVILKNSIFHYWLSPSDATSAINECYKGLEALLKTCEQMTVRVVNGILMINGQTVETKSSEMQTFIDHLTSLKIDNFSISEGATKEEFAALFEIFCSQPFEMAQLGGFQAVLEKFQLKHVDTKKLIFREIDEEETVVLKTDLGGRGEGKGGGGSEGSVGGILAFLKGDIPASDEKVAQAVKELASDPEKMAGLILQAAEIQKAASVEGGETLVDFVIGCLRRTYEGASKNPDYATQKGKKKLSKDLILVEEQLLKRMREMSAPDWDEEDLEAITETADDLTEEIKIDALADEYMAKVSATEAIENNILDIIKSESGSAGQTAIEKKLMDRGLGVSGWQGLMIKSGVSKGEGGGFMPGSVLQAIEHLDTLLDTMEKEFAKNGEPPAESEAQKVLNILEDVSKQIRHLSVKTGMKIQELVEGLKSDADAAMAIEKQAREGGKILALTRHQAFETVAEILREISEPIELIESAINMLNSQIFEDNLEQKANVMRIVSENTELVKALVEKLRAIASPDSKSPDSKS